MVYCVTEDGVNLLRETATALLVAVQEIVDSSKLLTSEIEDHSGKLGAHEIELVDVLDEITFQIAQAEQETEDVCAILTDVADAYQDIIDYDPFASADGGLELSPNKTGIAVNGQRVRTDDNGGVYAIRDPDSGEYVLEPNKSYSLNGYEYMTDDEGRIASVKGKLRIEQGRESLNDTVPDMRSGDERGHLIADIFGGANTNGNLVAMGFDLNRIEFRRLEKLWETALNEKKDVRVNIKPMYGSGDSKRPQGLLVTYTIDGKVKTDYLKNPKKEEK